MSNKTFPTGMLVIATNRDSPVSTWTPQHSRSSKCINTPHVVLGRGRDARGIDQIKVKDLLAPHTAPYYVNASTMCRWSGEIAVLDGVVFSLKQDMK